MKKYLQTGFLYPQKLTRAQHMTGRQLAGYFALLALILTFSLTSLLTTLLTDLNRDGQEIAGNIPPFTVEDSRLNTQEGQESFVHQTDSFLFFFDPNGLIQAEEIESNLSRLNVPVGIGLLQEDIYINVAGQTLPVTYDQLNGMDDSQFASVFNQFGQLSPLVLLVIFIIAYLASALALAYEWLIVALIANLLSSFLRLRWPFRKNARVALLSISVPTLILSAIEAFGFFVPFAFELKLGFAAYFIFTSYKSIAPKKEKKDQN